MTNHLLFLLLGCLTALSHLPYSLSQDDHHVTNLRKVTEVIEPIESTKETDVSEPNKLMQLHEAVAVYSGEQRYVVNCENWDQFCPTFLPVVRCFADPCGTAKSSCEPLRRKLTEELSSTETNTTDGDADTDTDIDTDNDTDTNIVTNSNSTETNSTETNPIKTNLTVTETPNTTGANVTDSISKETAVEEKRFVCQSNFCGGCNAICCAV